LVFLKYLMISILFLNQHFLLVNHKLFVVIFFFFHLFLYNKLKVYLLKLFSEVLFYIIYLHLIAQLHLSFPFI